MKILKAIKIYRRIYQENKRLHNYMRCRDKEDLLNKRNVNDILKIKDDYIMMLEYRIKSLQNLYFSMSGITVTFDGQSINMSRKDIKGDNIEKFPNQFVSLKWK